VIEDGEDDRFLIQRAFNRIGASLRVRTVNDGEEAVQYMMGEGEYADRGEYPYPHFVITDLKMHGRMGWLSWNS